jgi:hypothetical protein
MDDQFDRDSVSGYGQGAGTAARMKEEIAGKVSDAKEKVADFRRKAVDQIDSRREPVANTLDTTASALHQQGENAADVAHATNKLESTADYLREHDVKAIMGDVKDIAKRYPGQCLAAAVLVGFFVGRLFRNTD